mgnify:CR=1 FL=1
MKEEKKNPSLNANENEGNVSSNEENEINDNSNGEEKQNKQKNNLIVRNRGHSDFGHQLTYHKKLENELDTLPNDISKFFRHSLDKYQFQLEVYVPHSMVISKKEYYDKNYMLNNLVKTEDIIQDKKNQIAHISKETKKFSHQYEFVKNENMSHQLGYLNKIEQLYKNKGYNTTGINYKKEDNIFSPSFLLDTKYGTNSQTDVVKYGNNNNKREYKIDKWLLNKFDEVILKKKKGKKEKNEVQNKNEGRPILEDENDQKLLAQIKKELDEQIRIQNMTKEEYSQHSRKIKNDIEIIKDTINNFKELNEYFKKKKNNYRYNTRYDNSNSNLNSSLDKKRNNGNNNSIKDIKPKITYQSDLFLSSKGMKESSKEKSNNILPEINPRKRNTKSQNISISNKNKEDDKSKNDSKNSIPKLHLKGILNKKKSLEPKYLSERKLKEIEKEKQLNQLYDTLNNHTSNSIFPINEVNNYFNKYSPRRLPIVNSDRGSNIHGLVEEVQNIINDNNFANFAKMNYNARKDMKNKNNKNDNKNGEIQNNKILDDDYIINLDNKIRGMHYDFTDNLLSNKKDQFHIE